MTTNREKAEAAAEVLRQRGVTPTTVGYIQNLVDLADTEAWLAGRVLGLADAAWDAMDDEGADRQILLETLITELRALVRPPAKVATVVLFKAGGKYYTTEDWRIPEGAIGPQDMSLSPDFRRIGNGAVLVESQDPWGYPFLFPDIPE